MGTYPKIPNIFNRENDNNGKNLIFNNFTSTELEILSLIPDWEFTEKIDGANIRIIWDGYRVEIKGRTDKANLPTHQLETLNNLFAGEDNEEIFERLFGDKEVTLFGEVYGNKVQTNGYSETTDFTLFDVNIGGIWLERQDMISIANEFCIRPVPIVCTGNLYDGIRYVAEGHTTLIPGGTRIQEGLVGRAPLGLCDRRGNRIIVKIKYRDFKDYKGE